MRVLIFCLFVSVFIGCGNVTPHRLIISDDDTGIVSEQDDPILVEDDLLLENEETPDEDSIVGEDDPIQDDAEDPEVEPDEDSVVGEDDMLIDDSHTEEQDVVPDESVDNIVDTEEPDDAVETDIMPEDDVIPDIDNAETLLEIEGDTMIDEGTSTGHRLYSAKIIQLLGAKEMDDELMMWITGDSFFTVSYDFGVGLNADIKTCVQCVIIGEDWNDTSAKFERTYLASAGTFMLTRNTASSPKKMTLTDVKFREIEIAVDGSSTFVQDGIELTLFSPVSIDLP